MKLSKLVQDYFSSYDFNNLRDESAKQYNYYARQFLDTTVSGINFFDIKVSNLTTRLAKLAYNQWCDRGITTANHTMAVARIIFNHGVRMEICNVNPFSTVRRRTVQPRKVVWSREYIKKFLNTAYSDYNSRNIGLIAHMAYEWCQRLGDMRVLKFENIDFNERVVHIEQSKRRADVHLPIEDDLFDMLVQQNDEFGFQEYVAPRPKPIKGKYVPYSLYKLPLHARNLMDKAALPKELRLSDLRRTGTTEMVEAGVGMAQIMSVTGHSNPQSVKPYMKNTYASANNALTTRKAHGKST